MRPIKPRMRQVVDWSAAIWAGLLSGTIFLLLNMMLTAIYVGSPWVIVRLISSWEPRSWGWLQPPDCGCGRNGRCGCSAV